MANLRARRSLSPTARTVRARRLTYLTPRRLLDLQSCADAVNAEAVPGDVVECGVALGGSAILLASMKGEERAFHGYDVFGLIPPPGPNDPPEAHARHAEIASGSSPGLGGDVYYGYQDDLLQRVTNAFTTFGLTVGDADDIHLHRGLFDDTLAVERPVALAHVDSDWFDPVDTCLRRIAPHLEPGGFIVLDDYNDYGGCRAAADAYVEESSGALAFLPLAETMAIVRTAGY
ncbi:MAG TPA: TylF/MycF/NovP-related O-methyltransferase [Baekduia sp.]|nr:TylF/MycF/NovP-related O-methyltransferase [Baekduia sp.]